MLAGHTRQNCCESILALSDQSLDMELGVDPLPQGPPRCPLPFCDGIEVLSFCAFEATLSVFASRRFVYPQTRSVASCRGAVVYPARLSSAVVCWLTDGEYAP